MLVIKSYSCCGICGFGVLGCPCMKVKTLLTDILLERRDGEMKPIVADSVDSFNFSLGEMADGRLNVNGEVSDTRDRGDFGRFIYY